MRDFARIMQQHAAHAVQAMDILGSMPTLPQRDALRRLRHPGADVWEDRATEIGREFFHNVWLEAWRGDAVCQGYIEGELQALVRWPNYSGIQLPADDERVIKYAAKINARWTASLRATVE
jgi:hypothetical protein